MKIFLKSIVLLSILWLFQYNSIAQSQVVFTSTTNDTVYKFWRVNIDSPFIFDNISQKLDLLAPLQGKDYGPISVSHDGNWYAFTSERFGVDEQGWAALTIANYNFTSYEVIHDSLGQLIHSEGITYVFSGGNAIVFSADIGNHNRDIFVIHKNGNSWGMPKNLTVNSTYNYNYWPYISYDGTKVLFDAGATTFPSTAIGEVNIDGSGLHFPITSASMTNGIAAHSPCYGIDGSIIYEGDAGGERIWQQPFGSSTPALVNATYGDDNSPVTLPDGRIVSLWLPGIWHEIKIMNVDGTNGYLLTDSSSLFTEVYDIGISAGASYLTGISESINNSSTSIFPNPASDKINIYFSSIQNCGLAELLDITGKEIVSKKINQGETTTTIDCKSFQDGVYIIKILGTDNCSFKKVIVKK